MSVDFTDVDIYPSFKTFTVSVTANQATQVLLPSRVKSIQVGSDSGKIYVSHAGTDGADLGTSDRGFVPNNNLLSVKLGTGAQRLSSLFVAGASGGEKVVIILEE